MHKTNLSRDSDGQMVVENVLVVVLFVIVVIASIPKLRNSVVSIFSKDSDQSIVESTNSAQDSKNYFGWIPPGIAQSDDKVVYCKEEIILSDQAKITGNAVSNMGQDFHFPMPLFPQYPYGSVPAKGTLITDWQTTPIVENGYYQRMTISSSIIIHTGEEGDIREIIIDDLELGESGSIILQGFGKLKLYVRNTFHFKGSSTINANGSPNSVVMYYKGSDTLHFGGGNQVFAGSVYTESSDFSMIGGSSTIIGNIIVGGTSAQIENGSFMLTNFLLYAPHADLKLSGETIIRGKIVSRSIHGSGNAKVEFKPISLNDNFSWNN